MEHNNIDQVIDHSLDRLYQEEQARLEAFYSKPPEVLRAAEHTELIQQSIHVPLNAQERVKPVMESLGVSHVHTAWKRVQEKLPTFSYTYIDWDSLDHIKQADYRRVVSAKDYGRARKGLLFPIFCGCLAIGSIALVCLLPKINPWKKVFVLVSVVSVLAGGRALVRALTYLDGGQELSVSAAQSSGSKIQAIAEARRTNEETLRTWYSLLRQMVKQVCREALEA